MSELVDLSATKISNRKEKTFSDMPCEILAKIVENLDFKSQTKLRRVSYGLQKIVDRGKPPICGIFHKVEENLEGQFYYDNSNRQVFGHYTEHKSVLNDMAILLSNRRLRLETFRWVNESSHPELDKKLIDLMNSLDRKLEITYLRLKCQLNEDLLIAVLDKVKPKTLKKIEFGSSHPSFNIDRIASLDQWRQAETVFLKDIKLDVSRVFHHFLHLRFFIIEANTLSIEDLLIMRKISLESIKFSFCFIHTKNLPTRREIKDALGLDEKLEYFIPNSNKFLRLKPSSSGIQVNKILLEDL